VAEELLPIDKVGLAKEAREGLAGGLLVLLANGVWW